MPFDPSQYIKEKIGFDPNEYLAKKDLEQREKVSATEAFVRGGAQGLTADNADEITGGLEALVTDKLYKQARDESRANYRAAAEDQPVPYYGGMITGGAATLAIPGVAAATRAAPIAFSAGMGALQGLGASEAENFSAQQAKDVGMGLGVGGAFGIGGKLLSKAPAGAKGLAENRAAAALGAERGTIKSIGADKVRAAGRQALDEGVVTPLAETGEMIKRNDQVKQRGVNMMRDVYRQIDETGKKYFDPLDAAVKIEEKVGDFYRSPINKGETAQLENTLESILMRGDNRISLVEAQNLKEELSKVAKWKSQNVSDKELMARDAYFVISDQIDRAVEQGMKEIGKTDLVITLKKGKELYSNAKTSQKLLDNRYARDQGNKMGFGLTDSIILGGAYAATGNPISAIPAYAGKIAYDRYGSQSIASGVNAVSKALSQDTMGKAFSAAKSGLQMPTIDTLVKPRLQGTKYENLFSGDKQRDAITHKLMSARDPEYAALVLGEEKKKLANTRLPSLTQQVGDAIDQYTWTDRIGLDPQEKQDPTLMDVQQLPTPASIKPFSFKKLFPSKSAVGSEIKMLPAIEKYLFPREKLSTGENLVQHKIDKLYPDRFFKDNVSGEHGAVYYDQKNRQPNLAFARDDTSKIHEHTHVQMHNLNKLHPEADKAIDAYFKYKAKNDYDIPTQWITNYMHGPQEFMPIVGDILQDKNIRKTYLPIAREYDSRVDPLMRKLRLFYTDAATQAHNMTKEDLIRIIDEYKSGKFK